MRRGYIISCFILILSYVNAQQPNRCFTDELRANYLADNTIAPLALQQIENIIQQELQQPVSNARNVITIPVVIHVLHDGDPVGVSENISDAQILSQIAVLNQDFRRLNADANNTPSEFQPLAADIEIEFCLAQRDPEGNQTTGILRHNFGQTTYTDIFIDNTIKPQTNWNRDSYLNIYTARFGGDISNILGYASQPGFGASLDGVVVGYQYFGNTGNLQAPFNKGRTATHEVGHWLGLFHVWGISGGCLDDDNISDTPVADAPNYGCPSHPKVSCSSNDMFMNYMDYTNDACMNLFTAGQKLRMRAVLNTVRSNIASSLGCVAPPINTLDAALVDVIYPTANICENPLTPVVEIRNNGSQILTSLTILYQLNSGVLQQYQWTGNLAFTNATYVTLPAINGIVGNNNLFVSLTAPNNGSDQNTSNNDKILTFQIANPTQSVALPFSEGFENTAFPPSGWAIQNLDGDRTFEASNYGGFSNSFTGVLFDNFTGSAGNNPKNKTDGLLTPNFNLNGVNPRLSFSVAYARRNNNLNDSLKIFISTDCGLSWTNIYSKGGASLATAENLNQSFIPADTNWRKEIIGLAAYAIYPSVKLKFENKSDWGNNLYLDDINLEFAPTGVAIDDNIIDVQVYPNPASQFINIDIRNTIPEIVTVEIFDMLGKSIFKEQSEKTAGWQKQIDFTEAGKGVYFVKVSNVIKVINRKVMIQ